MTNSENIPKLRFNGFSDEWEKKVLGSMVEPIPSYPLSRSFETFSPTGYKYIHYGDIHRGRLKIIRDDSMMPNIESGNYQNLEQGDIILADASEDLEGVANACVIDYKPNKKVVAGLHTIALRPSKTNPLFLYYYFDTSSLKKYSRFIATGTKVLGISSRNLVKHEGWFPKESEQKAIGKLFQTLDQTLTLNREKYEKTKTLKKALLTKLFPQAGQSQPEMRLEGFSGDWVEMRLGEIVDIVGGGTPDTTNPDLWNGDIDWYSPTEIGKSVYADKSVKKITELGLLKSSAQILPANRTVLFTSRAGIGDMAILKKEGATNQGFQSLIAKDIDIYFLYSMGYMIKDKAIRKASGSTFLEISKKQLSDIELLISPIKLEQEAIGNLFKKLDETITLQAKQIKTLENLKKALLAKMFV